MRNKTKIQLRTNRELANSIKYTFSFVGMPNVFAEL